MKTTLKDRYINFFTDYGFKRLFGEEKNKDLLIDFLNTILADKENIVNLEYKSNENLGSTPVDRKAIFDLYCENDKGEKFIIELQKAKQNFFKDRSVFYSTFPIQEQAQRGDWDFKLKAVYTIGILDFCFDDSDKNKPIVNEVKLIDTTTNKVFYDKLSYYYLQMPNFTKSVNELETHFDKWLFAIKNLHNLEDKPEILSGIFQKFFKEAEISNYGNKEITAYEQSLKYYRDLKNTIDTAREEGREEGREEEKAILLPQIEKALVKEQEALAKEKEAIEKLVKMMKQFGKNKAEISKETGLSLDEIDRILSS